MNKQIEFFHRSMSFLKSGTRIMGFIGLVTAPTAGVVFLIFAELVGIVEEFPASWLGQGE